MSLGVSNKEYWVRQANIYCTEYYWKPDKTRSINYKLVDIEYVDNRLQTIILMLKKFI